MKKLILFLFGILLLASCNGCKNTDATTEVVNDSVLQMATVDRFIAVDRQDMYNRVGDTYRWYETQATFNKYLDEDCDGTLESVTNIFQANKDMDVTVFTFKHLVDTTVISPEMGFWIEDFPLNEAAITVSLDSAFTQLMQANCPKPHSRQVVLRKQIGPKECNPQYIFGNIQAQIYVDAITGDVSDKNPAFNIHE